ncbi:helix-turn-helix domain-containing protein [Halorientalis halophila]|uniref:helix-turn-helix domain-containing protein n=1 Tax=Halorientalis halophila TaxID=3108499 RepID=UPI00300A813B
MGRTDETRRESGARAGGSRRGGPAEELVVDPAAGAESEPIVVALVDDNPDWLSMQAKLLERRDDRFAVEATTDPLTVTDTVDAVDCVVSDYDMGPLDGLDLLSRVREARPTIPFILTTGRGDESVASRAISAGVTDYVVKEPGTDQSAVLAARIRKAVTRQRTERRLAESRQRFAELFEAIPEPVAIADADGHIESTNPAYEATFGDIDRLPAAVRDAPLGEQCELECQTTEGRQVFLHRGARLTGADRRCHTFTTITARAEREAARELELATREGVREALLSASTRSGLERAFCERLSAVRDDALVWIGDHDADGSPVVREAAGPATAYLDAVRAGAAADPGVRALETREPVFAAAPDLPDAAAETSIAAGGAIPLRRDGLPFGVVAAYTTEPGAFDAGWREMLSDLADQLAYAIAFVSFQRALFSGERVAVTLTLPAESYPVTDLFDAPVTVDGTVPYDDETVQHVVSIPDPVDPVPDPESVPGVEAVRRVGSDGDAVRLGVVLSRPTVDSLLVDRGGRIESVALRDDRLAVVASFHARDDVQGAVRCVTDALPEASVASYRTVDRLDEDRGADPTAALTERQRTALETAYRGGYFERPKRCNSEELAETLGVSRSTFLQHLRAAQRKLFDAVLDSAR